MNKVKRWKWIAGVVLGLILLIGMVKCKRAGENDKAQSAEKTVPVIIEPVSERQFEKRIHAQGTLESKNFALVPSRISGTITEFFVDEGAPVVAGETPLFQTDPVKYEQAVALYQQELNVADYALREKEAALRQVEAAFEKAEIDYKRYQTLLKEKVVTQDEFERVESAWKQQSALCDHAKALVALAGEQKEKANVALQMAEKDLADTLIKAPINGVVSKRFRELGEMAKTGDPVLRIDDVSTLDVSCFLPASVFGDLKVGDTVLRVAVNKQALGDFILNYKSPTIDETLRTFEMKTTIDNPPDYIASGDIAEISAVLDQRKGLGVPIDAVFQRNGKSCVFIVKDDVAHMVPVKTGYETDGWVELDTDQLHEHLPVVVQGQILLEDGDKVASMVHSQSRANSGE